jgi:hypothetical protein
MKLHERYIDGCPPVSVSMGEHVLTVAEAGFSMLDQYARFGHNVAVEDIRRFAARVNDADEAGSLFPVAPISAVPRKYLRGEADPAGVFRHAADFLKANAATMHACRILIDLRVGPDPVPRAAIDACKAALLSPEAASIKYVRIAL